MKYQIAKLPSVVKIILGVGLILGLLVGVTGLNILVQHHTTSSKQESQKKIARLDIAVVNEDKPVVIGENSYNLGTSYIKNIERDDQHNWSVVSRGTAESGLDAGDYQLVIYVPNDFSAKILEVDKPVVEKTRVTYKVNSNGNLHVENEANQVANAVVAELNSQLVDMYIASILSNLYSAQQNVKEVAETKGQNIQQFETSLYTTSQAFPSAFPNLVSISNSAVTSNNALLSSLSTYSTLYSGLQTNQGSVSTNLSDLIEGRASQRVSYGNFMEALMGMEGKVLGEETSNMIAQLAQQQEQVLQLVGTSQNTNSGQEATAYTKTVQEIEENIQILLKQMEASQANLKARLENVDTAAEEILQSVYEGKANLDEIKVRDVLADESFSISAEDYAYQMDQVIQSSVDRLPNLDPTVYSGRLNVSGLDKFVEIGPYDFSLVQKYATNYKSNTDLDDRLNQAVTQLNAKKTAYITQTPHKQEVEITVVNQSELPVSSWTIVNETTGTSETKAAGETATIDLSHKVRFEFQFEVTTPATPPVPADPTPSSTKIGPVTIMTLAGKTVATTSNLIEEEYRQAYGHYMAVAQEVVDAYNQAGHLLNSYYVDGVSLTDQFLDQSAKNYLLGIIKRSIVSSLGSYQGDVESDLALSNAITELKNKQGQLTTDLATIRATNYELSDRVKESITLVNGLRQDYATIRSREGDYSQSSNQSDTGLSNLERQLQALMSTTQGVADSADANTKQAESVNQVFNSFNQATQDAKTNADTLSAEAEKLLNQFREEMEETQNFATAFETVFSNAYANGVPNEILLDFMSSPVVSEASSIKAPENTYRPFTWILLLEIVSLFAAYIFATHKLIKRVEDKFKTSRWLQTDVANTVALSLVSVLNGLVIGIVSSQRLGVDSAQVPSWVSLIVLFSLILVHGQYFLLKNLKSLGMGLSLFTIISFVYLSSAVGTTSSLSGIPATLKSLNILSIIEEQLSSYFDGQTAGVGLVFLLVLVVAALIAGNIFFTMDQVLNKWNTKETHV